MRMRKPCYCEIGFLRDFFAIRPVNMEPNEETIHLTWLWVSLFKFISKASIILDISKLEFEKLIDSNKDLSEIGKNIKEDIDTTETSAVDSRFVSWLKLINKSEGLIDFTESEDSFPYISEFRVDEFDDDDQRLNAVYLTTQNDAVCKKQSKMFGVIVLNSNLAKECAHLFMDIGHAFPSNDAKDWSFLKGIKFPSLNICNSIIIVDNYLFIDDMDKYCDGKVRREWMDKIEQNLQPILQALLPEKLDDGVMFEIAIFTAQDKDNPDKSFETQYQSLNTYLSVKRKNIKFRINFYGKCHEVFHDRCILTNNVWISSGHGFDIFSKNRGSLKPTTINIAFPFLQSSLLWCDGSYLNVLSQAKKIIDSYPDKYWGDCKRHNRIVSYFIRKDDVDSVAYKKTNIIQYKNCYKKRDTDGNIIW